MPFELIVKKKISTENIREVITSILFSSTNSPEKGFILPKSVVGIVNEYVEAEDEKNENIFTGLSDKEKAMLILITYASLFNAEDLTPGFPVRMSALLQLPVIVKNQHGRLGLPTSRKTCPRYSFYIDTSKGASMDASCGSIKIYQNTLDHISKQGYLGLSNLELKTFYGIVDAGLSPENRVDFHAPFPLVLALEIAKERAYQQVLDSSYSQQSRLAYLCIAQNLEKAKSLYKDLGYMHLDLMTVYLFPNIIDALFKSTLSQEQKWPGSKAPALIDKIRGVLVEQKIHCPQLEYSLHTSCPTAVIPLEDMPTLFKNPEVKECFQSGKCESEALSGREFMTLINATLSTEDKPSNQSKLVVLEKFVTLLSRVYCYENGLDTIVENIEGIHSRLHQFLQKKLGSMPSIFKSDTSSYKLAIYFLGNRIKEVQEMHSSFSEKLPKLYQEVYSPQSNTGHTEEHKFTPG